MAALLEHTELESEPGLEAAAHSQPSALPPIPPLPHRQGFFISKLPPRFLPPFGKEAGSWVLVIPVQDKHLWDKASDKTHP